MDEELASGSTDRNRKNNPYEDDSEPSAHVTSPARMDSAQRLVDRMPVNPKKMVFMSTQEIFEVPLRPDHESHNFSRRKRHNSDDGSSDSDFVKPPVTCASKQSHPPRWPAAKRKHAPRTETRRANQVPYGPGLEAQSNDGCSVTDSPILNVRCNPGDVLFTITLLTPNQYAALVALGFGPFLTMLTDAVESRLLLPWLLDRINPDEMVLRIGPGKNIAVTPSIISMVLGIPHGGRNIKLYTTEEGRQFKKDLIKDLGQECLHDGDDIHISNLQEEILKGNVDYHDPLSNNIIPTLSDAISLAAPRQFPCLKNWRCAPVQLAYHKNSNDSGLCAFRFLEYYDGEGHGSLKTTIDPDRAKDMRADILHYLCFHTNNSISQIPDELQKFRDG